jgi:serine/threonine-protein kinase
MFGRYHVLHEIGKNTLGPIYLGRLEGPQGFQRWAAIRTLGPERASDPNLRKLFFERAREGAKMLHPNVATIFDVGEEGTAPWSASEYLHGERLSEVIDRIEIADTPMSWEIAARLVIDAAEGLHALHQLKSPDGAPLHRVHGNVAPHVFMATYDGSCKIKGAFEPRRPERDPRTVPYTAPEQLFTDEASVPADVFALGAILWELCAGRHLFLRTSEDETRAMIEAGLVPSVLERVDSAPRELDALIAKALARSTSVRFATARDFGRALEDLLFSKRQRVRQEDVGRYLRTVFADRYLEQEHKLKEAADVTEVYRRSQHGIRAALPNLAPPEADEDGDGDATTVMPNVSEVDDQTTAERPAAVLPGRLSPPRAAGRPAPFLPSADSSPTVVRPGAPADPYADSGSLPTLVRPNDTTPDPQPMLLPLNTLPLSNLRTAPIPAYTPPKTSSSFLSEPSMTPSQTDLGPAPPVSEGSAVFVAPRPPLRSSAAELDAGGDTATGVLPREAPPPVQRPSTPPPLPRRSTPPPALQLRAGTPPTLGVNDASVVAPPPRPREERTMTHAGMIPAPAPTLPRSSPDERTLTAFEGAAAIPSTARIPVPGAGPRRADPNERTLTAYDVAAPQGQMSTQPPMQPVGYVPLSPANMPALPPGDTGAHDPRTWRKQVATVAVFGVVGGVVIFLLILFATRSPEPTPVTLGAPKPSTTIKPSATTPPTASTAKPPPTVTATVPPPPPPSATAPPIPTLDLHTPPPPTATATATSKPTARTTTRVTPPPPPPTAPVNAGNGKGFLTVMCRPAACDQVLDGGQDLGGTPLYRQPLSVGKHVLTLRVSSPRAEKTVPVFIVDGETTKINPDMSP